VRTSVSREAAEILRRVLESVDQGRLDATSGEDLEALLRLEGLLAALTVH
jgi:hypothetical protein